MGGCCQEPKGNWGSKNPNSVCAIDADFWNNSGFVVCGEGGGLNVAPCVFLENELQPEIQEHWL